IRSIACLRLSSSSSVYWLTSPCRRAEKLAPNDLAKPMLRTTRPKATPSWASTARPGISNAVVTGNAEDEDSVMTATLGRAPGPPSEKIASRQLGGGARQDCRASGPVRGAAEGSTQDHRH